MLRALRAADLPAYRKLYRDHFPEEARVLLADEVAFERVLRRAFAWDARLVLGLLRLIGRPLGYFYALELDGRLAGSAFVFFSESAGHVVSVVVDTPYQRQGHARELMAAVEGATRRRGVPFSVLEVISTNTPARRLYDSLGYRPLRRVAWYYRDLGAADPPLPAPPSGPAAAALRPFRPADGEALARLARSLQPPEDRAVRPIGPRSFRAPPILMAALGSDTEAFVVDHGGVAQGFVRLSSSGAFPSGHLVAPFVAPSLPEAEAEALLDRGLAWFREHPVRRIVCEVPLDDAAGVRRLEARGFQVGLTVEAMARRVAS